MNNTLKIKRNNKGFSLLETMTVISVLAVVTGLLYGYSEQGWSLFYQSYSRGLSQVKAKLAIRNITEELREANKNRISINGGSYFGVPFPDDAIQNSPYIYFTKPYTYEETGDVIGYDYVLYYFAKPINKNTTPQNRYKKSREKQTYYILKIIKFLNQSKYYTEDNEKTWPFQPPIIEIGKSSLPEDKEYIISIEQPEVPANTDEQAKNENITEELFLDHFAKLKKDSRNIPISSNFIANSLTDPFSNKEAKITFGDDYKSDKPVTIMVLIEESPILFSLMGAMTEFEATITPRN